MNKNNTLEQLVKKEKKLKRELKRLQRSKEIDMEIQKRMIEKKIDDEVYAERRKEHKEKNPSQYENVLIDDTGFFDENGKPTELLDKWVKEYEETQAYLGYNKRY